MIGNGSDRIVSLDLLGAIAGALSRANNTPNILEKIRGIIKSNGNSFDVPYPGMSEAFEAHFGQSFEDRDWRIEASVWAASWKAASRSFIKCNYNNQYPLN